MKLIFKLFALKRVILNSSLSSSSGKNAPPKEKTKKEISMINGNGVVSHTLTFM